MPPAQAACAYTVGYDARPLQAGAPHGGAKGAPGKVVPRLPPGGAAHLPPRRPRWFSIFSSDKKQQLPLQQRTTGKILNLRASTSMFQNRARKQTQPHTQQHAPTHTTAPPPSTHTPRPSPSPTLACRRCVRDHRARAARCFPPTPTASTTEQIAVAGCSGLTPSLTTPQGTQPRHTLSTIACLRLHRS